MSQRLCRHLLLAVLALCLSHPTLFAAGNVMIRGLVRDSISGEPLPYASVTVDGSPRSAVADDNGVFEITVPTEAKALFLYSVGYTKKRVELGRSSLNMYVVDLAPATVELHELVVKPKKYSKHNNPAVDFVNRIRAGADLTDPVVRNPYYSYDKYQRITLALNDIDPLRNDSAMLRRYPFLKEHIDTSDVSGKTILNIAVKEKASTVHNRRKPRSTKEIVGGTRAEGIDEIADAGSMQVFFDDVLREIDLYQNDLNLLQNRFVSPLSPIAPDFYKFYLTDTVEIDGERCIMLSFYPHNRAAFGFNGHIYVPVADTTMFIKRVEMSLPRGINLNFIDKMYLSQTFRRADDGSRLKTTDDLVLEIKPLPGTRGLYARRNVAYAGHTFDAVPDSIFSLAGATVALPGATTRDDDFWHDARLIAMPSSESRVGLLMTRLRKYPAFYWGEQALKVLFTGYVPTGKNSKFDYGPVNTTVSFNSIEGLRMRAGGITTANLSRRWFGRGYVAYGTRDHRWKYRAEAEYSFVDKEYHSREFPMHALRLTSQYDIDHPGQHYLFTNADNFVMSLKRMVDNHVTYQQLNKLEYILELRNNFSINATVSHQRQYDTPGLQFIDGYGRHIGHFDETSLSVELRYAPGEKFYQGRTTRIPINLDAPVITLRHTFAPKNFAGNTFAVNKTELNVQKRFWLSAFGFIDAYAGGGYAWTRSAYLNLFIPNANLSYTIQPQSFALMNPMEFVNSSYATVDVTYWANGAILNYIPLIKKLKLREAFSFRALYGRLGSYTDPALHPELLQLPADANVQAMRHGPYMECGVGLDNIFRCLRIDYVWRLSYLDVPYEIDRHGLRIAMHITF